MFEIDEEEYLEHAGVKGMKWGKLKVRGRQGQANKSQTIADRRPTRGNVRKAQRAQIRADRVKRLMSGNGTFKDKLVRDLDIGGVNTTVNGPASKQKRVAMGAAAAAALISGGIQLNNILRISGKTHISQLPKF